MGQITAIGKLSNDFAVDANGVITIVGGTGSSSGTGSSAVEFATASDTQVLPSNPVVGQVFEYVGINAWTITASENQYIRNFSSEGTTLTAASPYVSVQLVYVGAISGHNTWLVTRIHGSANLT